MLAATGSIVAFGRFFAGISSSEIVTIDDVDAADRSDVVLERLFECIDAAEGDGEAALGVARVSGFAEAAGESDAGSAGFC